MGCDIHLHTEYKDKDGNWQKVIKGLQSDYYSPDSDHFNTDEYKDGGEVYSGRNYTLFSYLANVRNGWGFAGCDTGNAIDSMDDHRGMPEDVSEGIDKEHEAWSSDAHSASFFNLKELKGGYERAKQATKTDRGYVDLTNYREFKENGSPEYWCGGVGGDKTETVSNSKMDELIIDAITAKRIKEAKGLEVETLNIFGAGYVEDKAYYTQIEWERSLADEVKHFFDHVIPQLEDWAKKHSEEITDEAIRVVFWFDN